MFDMNEKTGEICENYKYGMWLNAHNEPMLAVTKKRALPIVNIFIGHATCFFVIFDSSEFINEK